MEGCSWLVSKWQRFLLLHTEAEPYGLRLVLYLEGFEYYQSELLALAKERLRRL